MDISATQDPEEQIRLIHRTMEQAKGLSNFAGVSAVAAGVVCTSAAMIMGAVFKHTQGNEAARGFLGTWGTALVASLAIDYLHVRRQTRGLDKALAVRLLKQRTAAAWPPLLFGVALTISFLIERRQDQLYPYWILVYGCAVLAVAQKGSQGLTWLGRGLMAAGIVSLLAQTLFSPPLFPQLIGLPAMVLAFGLMNVAYGIWAGQRSGW